jgi:hypothetical protein
MVGIMYLASATCWLFINCTNSLDRPNTANVGQAM